MAICPLDIKLSVFRAIYPSLNPSPHAERDLRHRFLPLSVYGEEGGVNQRTNTRQFLKLMHMGRMAIRPDRHHFLNPLRRIYPTVCHVPKPDPTIEPSGSVMKNANGGRGLRVSATP
jgi:hypothetical protein